MAPQPQTAQERRTSFSKIGQERKKSFAQQNSIAGRRKSISKPTGSISKPGQRRVSFSTQPAFRKKSFTNQLPPRKKSFGAQTFGQQTSTPPSRILKQMGTLTAKAGLKARMLPSLVFAGVAITAKALEMAAHCPGVSFVQPNLHLPPAPLEPSTSMTHQK